MIFAKTADKVLAGEKTQTRRPMKDGDVIETPGFMKNLNIKKPISMIFRVGRGGRLLWEQGRTYAVQPGRTAKSVGRTRLTGLRSEPLYWITHDDARAEGFSGRDEFVRVWQELYPKGSLLAPVYVLEFELVKEKTE